MGFETYWLKDKEHPNFDFSNSLFIAMGLRDKHIPLRSDCQYILHNCKMDKFQELFDNNNCMILQVYTHPCTSRKVTKLADCIYADYGEKTLYMPWATDLIPSEIEEIIGQLKLKRQKKNVARFIGTCAYHPSSPFSNLQELAAFKRGCLNSSIPFEITSGVDMKTNTTLTQEALIAPTIQGKWQCEQGYIPCRIFKNISYGQMGITNSKAVADLFKGKILYNENPEKLAHEAIKAAQKPSLEKQINLMKFVKDHHTYINRIHSMLSFLEYFKPL